MGLNSYYSDLHSFKAEENSIEIKYSDNANKEQTKTFEMLSESFIQDETDTEYQCFGSAVK